MPKDACYHKVKRQYKVFPSAYASGAIAKCRKKKAGGGQLMVDLHQVHTAIANTNLYGILHVDK